MFVDTGKGMKHMSKARKGAKATKSAGRASNVANLQSARQKAAGAGEAVVAQGAVCYHCHKALQMHYNKNGEFIGCRRRKDAGKLFFMPPFTMGNIAFIQTPAKGTIRRGRAAGVYVVTGKKEPDLKELTASQKAAWNSVKGAKQGVSLREIAEKNDIPPGTVAWALHILTQQGAIKHLSPQEAAALAA